YGRPILKRWFRRLHGKIAVSRPAMEFVSQYFPGYYNIIPNGIDYQRFSRPRARMPQFDDGKLNILFVGRLEKRKGLAHLLRAYSRAKPRLPNSRLIIVGPVSQKQRGYQAWIDATRLADVHWTGFVSDDELPRYYQTADIFCSPATGQESFGIVLLEAMATGTSVLATRIPGYAGVVTDGLDGTLVPPKDDRALAEALFRLAADRNYRESLAARGHLTAAKYDWPLIAKQVLDYYERLRSESGSVRQPIRLRPRFRYLRALRG
ncbi:MAG TPA: glycosyltransferase family 4 protein, partial [Dehalococcoidia bacterium]|nr:glycosyltransferase family 4 protein [Dehalococcoidia bacterium]